ncbi:MAG: hypothetical protein ACKV2U_21200 [Bryobacteraceae bacterium]
MGGGVFDAIGLLLKDRLEDIGVESAEFPVERDQGFRLEPFAAIDGGDVGDNIDVPYRCDLVISQRFEVAFVDAASNLRENRAYELVSKCAISRPVTDWGVKSANSNGFVFAHSADSISQTAAPPPSGACSPAKPPCAAV